MVTLDLTTKAETRTDREIVLRCDHPQPGDENLAIVMCHEVDHDRPWATYLYYEVPPPDDPGDPGEAEPERAFFYGERYEDEAAARASFVSRANILLNMLDQ